jgi:predicted nucleic acid-binding protein
MSRAFFDTNIFVYALGQSPDDDRRRMTARALIRRYTDSKEMVLSTQVLIETFHNARKKLALTPAEATRVIRQYARAEVVATDADLFFEAAQLVESTKLSIFDALILSAAAKARCEMIYTEDLNAGQVIGGVRVVNPFAG